MRRALWSVLCGLSVCSGCLTSGSEVRDPYEPRKFEGSWCMLGTSVTWYCGHVGSAHNLFSTGYDAYVKTVLTFTEVVNCGVNGGCVADQVGKVKRADYYTIEHGVNDWANGVPVGALDDYLQNRRNGTFYANYRILVDRIRALNPEARIIVCTPRRAFGYGSYLPSRLGQKVKGETLERFAEAVREIAAAGGFSLADFYGTGAQTEQELVATSMDMAFHPNDRGHAEMAKELLRAFARVD